MIGVCVCGLSVCVVCVCGVCVCGLCVCVCVCSWLVVFKIMLLIDSLGDACFDLVLLYIGILDYYV